MPDAPTNPYLYFEDCPPTAPEGVRKTHVVHVFATRSDARLGTIRWWGAWRQYAFFPEVGTLFNTGCMASLIVKVDELNTEWKDTQRAKRASRPDAVAVVDERLDPGEGRRP